MLLMNKIKSNCILITSIILFLDQLTKYIIKNNFKDLNYKNYILFSINIIKNNGAAFNLFADNILFLILISILSSIFIIVLLIRSKKLSNLDRYGFSFILGGSLGNGLDRIIDGYVLDFINLNFINFPIFNIADISINVGFFIILYNLIRNKN